MAIALHLAAMATLSLAPPTIDVPANGGLVCTRAVPFAGTANYNGLDTNTITVVTDGQTVTGPVASGGTWSVPVTVDADGPFVATLTETQVLIGVSTTTSGPANVDFHVETSVAPPSIAVPTNGQVYVTATPLMSGTAPRGTIIDLTVANALLQDAGSFSGPVDDGGSWSAQPALGVASAGTFVLHATVNSNDACDWTSADVAQALVIDPTPATLLSPDGGAVLNTGAVTLTGTGVPTTQVIVTVGDAGAQVGVNDAGRWSMPATLAAGTNTVTVQDVDRTGGTSAATSTDLEVALTVITSPGSGLSVPQQLTVEGTAAPLTTITLTISGSADGGQIADSLNVDGDGGWSDAVTLAPGSHTATAIDVDGSGNFGSSDAVTFTVISGGSSSSTTASTASSTSAAASSSGASSGSAGSSGAASTTGSSSTSTATGSSGATTAGSTSTSSTGGAASAGASTSGGSASGGSSGGSSPSLYRACGCSSDDGPLGLGALLFAAAFTRRRPRP